MFEILFLWFFLSIKIILVQNIYKISIYLFLLDLFTGSIVERRNSNSQIRPITDQILQFVYKMETMPRL